MTFPATSPDSSSSCAAAACSIANSAPMIGRTWPSAIIGHTLATTDSTISPKTAEVLPIRVSFPSLGPSLFLVSELTGESKGAVIDLTYQKDGKGGVR